MVVLAEPMIDADRGAVKSRSFHDSQKNPRLSAKRLGLISLTSSISRGRTSIIGLTILLLLGIRSSLLCFLNTAKILYNLLKRMRGIVRAGNFLLTMGRDYTLRSDWISLFLYLVKRKQK